MRAAQFLLAAVSVPAMLIATAARADDKPYTEGTVWTVAMVHIKAGMADTYWREIMPLRKKINDEAKKQGLLLSERILSGSASSRDDFNVLILDEYKNFAAFDGMSAKYDAILSAVVGSEDKRTQMAAKRLDVREFLGDKIMHELLPK